MFKALERSFKIVIIINIMTGQSTKSMIGGYTSVKLAIRRILSNWLHTMHTAADFIMHSFAWTDSRNVNHFISSAELKIRAKNQVAFFPPDIFCWLGLFFYHLFSTEFDSHGHYQIPCIADRLTCYYKYQMRGRNLKKHWQCWHCRHEHEVTSS
jgi:hypothetical protein